MSGIFDFLSSNHGFLTAVSTFSIALSTLAVVVLTRILVNENKIWREASTEPEVVAFLHTHDGFHAAWIYFSVINVGNGPAKNVMVSLENGTEEEFERCGVAIPYDYQIKYTALPAGAKRTYVFSRSTDVFGFKDRKHFKEYKELNKRGAKLEQRARDLEKEYQESDGQVERERLQQEADLLNQELDSVMREIGIKKKAIEEIEKRKWEAKDLEDRLPPLHVNVAYERLDGRPESKPQILDVGHMPPWAEISQTPEQYLSRSVDALRQSAMVVAASTASEFSSAARSELMKASGSAGLDAVEHVVKMANLVVKNENKSRNGDAR